MVWTPMVDAVRNTSLATSANSSIAKLWTIVLIVCLAAVQVCMVLFRQIHMDEFLFLSKVFEYERGSLGQVLQTFHVHLFSWLSLLLYDDFVRLIVARSVMLLLHAATLYFLFKTARTFVSVQSAFCIMLIYATALYVVQYATSFRADGILAALFMATLFGLTRKNLSPVVLILSALSMAIAGLISIKAVFYVPVIAMMALWRLAASREWRSMLLWMAVATVIAAFAFAILYYLHSVSLVTHTLAGSGAAKSAGSGINTIAAANTELSTAVSKQLIDNHYFGTLWYLVALTIANPLQFILIIAGILVAAFSIKGKKGSERLLALTVLAFAFPLALVIFYRNSFPYFYVFMLPSVPLVTVCLFDANRFSIMRRLPALISTLMVIQAVGLAARDIPKNNEGQRKIQAAIHQIFPEPVTYLDGSAEVPSFVWAGIFMTSWGMDGYERSHRPVYSEIITNRKPRFVIADNRLLASALETGENFEGADYPLRPEDLKTLHENYVQHWGPIWVAGRKLADTDGNEVEFTIVIDGQYTFEAQDSGLIDGRKISPGELVALAEGVHSYAGPAATMRWGNHLPVPDGEPPKSLYLIEPGLNF